MKITFTKHSEDRLLKRKILKEEIIEIIKKPDKIIKKYGKYCYQKRLERGKIEICCEKIENNIKVITIYWI